MQKRDSKVILSLFITITFLLIILNTSSLISQNEPQIPQGGATSILGEVDPNTGLPRTLSEYRENADELRTREQNNSFLLRSWTNLAAANPVIGPILFYTEKFFSVFNFLWEYSFGMKFSWSFAFFIHFIIWFIITWVIFLSLKDTDLFNPVFAFITGAIVASITGSLGIIGIFFNFINTMIVDFLGLTILAVIIILLLAIYGMILHRFKGESGAEKLKRADERRLAAGEVAEKFLKIGN